MLTDNIYHCHAWQCIGFIVACYRSNVDHLLFRESSSRVWPCIERFMRSSHKMKGETLLFDTKLCYAPYQCPSNRLLFALKWFQNVVHVDNSPRSKKRKA